MDARRPCGPRGLLKALSGEDLVQALDGAVLHIPGGFGEQRPVVDGQERSYTSEIQHAGDGRIVGGWMRNPVWSRALPLHQRSTSTILIHLAAAIWRPGCTSDPQPDQEDA